MKEKHNSQIEEIVFSGIEVQEVFEEGDTMGGISLGRFLIENRSAMPKRAVVSRVDVIAGTAGKRMKPFFVYRLPDYDECADKRVTVTAGERMEIVVSFPPIPPPGSGGECRVNVELKSGRSKLLASSPVSIVKMLHERQ